MTLWMMNSEARCVVHTYAAGFLPLLNSWMNKYLPTYLGRWLDGYRGGLARHGPVQ